MKAEIIGLPGSFWKIQIDGVTVCRAHSALKPEAYAAWVRDGEPQRDHVPPEEIEWRYWPPGQYNNVEGRGRGQVLETEATAINLINLAAIALGFQAKQEPLAMEILPLEPDKSGV